MHALQFGNWGIYFHLVSPIESHQLQKDLALDHAGKSSFMWGEGLCLMLDSYISAFSIIQILIINFYVGWTQLHTFPWIPCSLSQFRSNLDRNQESVKSKLGGGGRTFYKFPRLNQVSIPPFTPCSGVSDGRCNLIGYIFNTKLTNFSSPLQYPSNEIRLLW